MNWRSNQMAQPGDVIEHPITGERITFLRTAEQTDGAYLRIELAVPPGGFVSARHIHPLQEERFLIVTGTFDFTVSGREFRITSSGRTVVPAGALHGWKNGGDAEAVALIDFVPALNAAECFESAFGLAQDGLVDPVTGIPDQPWLALMLYRYRDFVQVPELPLPVLLETFGPIVEEAERAGLRLPYPYPYARHRLLAAKAA
jgi:quercetin dioxygenase-like cupin family protein